MHSTVVYAELLKNRYGRSKKHTVRQLKVRISFWYRIGANLPRYGWVCFDAIYRYRLYYLVVTYFFPADLADLRRMVVAFFCVHLRDLRETIHACISMQTLPTIGSTFQLDYKKRDRASEAASL